MGQAELEELLQAVAVTAELTGTELSKAAARVMVQELSVYPLDQVLGALERCRRELTGRLTLAAVLQRLDDGRPSADEAWAAMPRDEAASVVWTQEMAEAWGVAQPLIEAGDIVAARMAFRQAYEKRVMEARNQGVPPKWTPSLGHDPGGRQAVLEEAVRLGRLSARHAQKLLPNMPGQSLRIVSADEDAA